MSKLILISLTLLALAFSTSANIFAQDAEGILKTASDTIGGDRYLKVTSQVGRGRFSLFKDGMIASSQTFIDVIVYPDKERTEFKGGKTKFVQTNVGTSGWVYDGDQELIKVQNETQIDNFQHGMRVSLDTLLRGAWRGKGELSYVGRRPATLGKRNDVVRLKYEDGLTVEFEFAEDGMPIKASYKRTNSDGEEATEEDRYAQWVDVGGIRTPYIVDRFTNGKPTSRINYEFVEFNVRVPESIFNKPTSPKELKKDLKL
ncbi:MAG: hypothetical protein ABIR33_03825 [Pyrinomonadaceae bacterium]